MNQTPIFLLRPWQTGDEESLAKHANNYKIWKNVRDTFPHPYTLTDAHDWVGIASKQPATFAIEVNNQAVGGVGVLFQEDIYRKNAEIGYWIGEEYWGKGIVPKAVRELVDYVFDNYDITRIYAGIFAYNNGSARVLEKVGFKHEATLKQTLMKEGKVYDAHIWAVYKNS